MVLHDVKRNRAKINALAVSFLAIVMSCRYVVVVNSFCVLPPKWNNFLERQKHIDGALRGSETKLANEDTCLQSVSMIESSEKIQTWTDQHVGNLLVHWRGEDVEGYSLQFRHIEFKSALAAVIKSDESVITSAVQFYNALNYTGTKLKSPLKINGYNQAMQYLSLPNTITVSSCIEAAKRCSLIHAVYLIVAETDTTGSNTTSIDSYDRLTDVAIQNNAFADMRMGNVNANHTWSLRVRHYGSTHSNGNDNNNTTSSSKDRRYGERTRSITLEQRALKTLTPILCHLGGKVNLHNPDCKIYVFDGLLSQSQDHETNNTNYQLPALRLILARRITSGARRMVSAIHPTTRICITNTPLCPLASFIMANMARIRPTNDGFVVLDPYCGSGGTLLAAAMILQMSKDEIQSNAPYPLVGIEVCHDGIVNRDDIRRDFTTRQWTHPITLLQGDSTQSNVRRIAREAIGDRPFDAIITDPPYGIRESNKGANHPIQDLLRMLIDDQKAGTPLLRAGGRLVVFIPHRIHEETIEEIFPTNEQLRAAGLICEYCKEQPLNDMLSRWLVSYVCVS
jgi:hypothetical protein